VPVINQLLGQATKGQPTPVVGMGCTILSVSDRAPGTIFRVFTYRKCVAIEVRADDYTLKDHYMDSFKINVKGHRMYYVFKNGLWVRLSVEERNADGTPAKFKTTTERGALRIGERSAYYDPHI